MKIIIKQSSLAKAMSHVVGIVDRKQTIPVLGYVLFEAKKNNGLILTSTNMDITIVDTLSCDVIEEGTYCISAHLLFELTKKIPGNADMIFETRSDENTVSISSGKSRFSINYIESTEFPPLPTDNYNVLFDIDADIFKNAIEVARVAMLQDNSRFHLNGIHIHHDNDLGQNKLCFVATDLYRIACVSLAVPLGASDIPPIIVSKKAVNEMLKLIDDMDSKTLHIQVSDSKIALNIEDEVAKTMFSSRLVSGNFPEYKGALLVSNDKILVVDTKALISAIDRVRTVVVDITSSVKLSIHPDKVVVSGISRELGRGVEEIDASFNVLEPMDICFNSKYLLDILSQIRTTEVQLSLAESNSSTIITPVTANQEPGQYDYVFAIMPIEIVNS